MAGASPLESHWNSKEELEGDIASKVAKNCHSMTFISLAPISRKSQDFLSKNFQKRAEREFFSKESIIKKSFFIS